MGCHCFRFLLQEFGICFAASAELLEFGGNRYRGSSLLRFFAGMALFWDIMVPGMLLGAIVGFANSVSAGKLNSVATAR
jgi:hypothetical protein